MGSDSNEENLEKSYKSLCSLLTVSMQRHLHQESIRIHERLNQALKQTKRHQSQVQNHAQTLHENVNASFARQMEALSQRRQWLLGQVDLMCAEKCEVLQRQHERLQHAMMEIEKASRLSETASSESDRLNATSQLLSAFDLAAQLASLVESAPAGPSFTFYADSHLLREVIAHYGCIVHGYSAGSDLQISSDLVCGKNLQEHVGPIEPRQDSALSQWLVPRGKEKASRRESVDTFKGDDCSFEVMPNSSKSSLQNWLLVDKSVTLSESPRRLSHSSSSSSSSTGSNSSAEYTRWLHPGSSVPQRQLHQLPPLTTTAYFDHVKASDSSHWLQRSPSCGQQQVECSRLTSEAAERHFSQALESTHLLSEEQEKDMDCAEIVAQVCCKSSSGQPCCKSFTECASTVNCGGRMLDAARPAWNEWLLASRLLPECVMEQQQQQYQCSNPVVAQMDRIAASTSSEWLTTGRTAMETSSGVEECHPEPVLLETEVRDWEMEREKPSLFQDLCMSDISSEMHKWLCKGDEKEEKKTTTVEDDMLNKWLLHRSTNTTSMSRRNSGGMKMREEAWNAKHQQWLVRRQQQQPVSGDIELQETQQQQQALSEKEISLRQWLHANNSW